MALYSIAAPPILNIEVVAAEAVVTTIRVSHSLLITGNNSSTRVFNTLSLNLNEVATTPDAFRSQQYGGSQPQPNARVNNAPQFKPRSGPNSQPLGTRTVNAIESDAGPPMHDGVPICNYCGKRGHIWAHCKARKVDEYDEMHQDGYYQVSFSPDAYMYSHAEHAMGATLPTSRPVFNTGSDLSFNDMYDEIGMPLPCNPMPDPSALNAECALDSEDHINTLSNAGLKIVTWRLSRGGRFG